MTSHLCLALLLGGAMSIVCLQPAAAQSNDRRSYDIPAQGLGDSLRALSIASGRNILAPTDTVADRQAPSLKGQYTVEDAVIVLLQGSGLRSRRAGNTIIIERGVDASSDLAAGADIVVTGSRIRGANVASPVITLDSRTIRDSG